MEHQHEDFTSLFRSKLQECLRQKKKYHGQFDAAEKERVARAFKAALNSPRMSETSLLNLLTGKKLS